MDNFETAQLKLRPHHCGISVPDLATSVAWYRDVLGFSMDMHGQIPQAHAKVAFMRNGDFLLEIFEVESAVPMPESRRHPNTDITTHGTKHIAFEVPDIRKLIDHLKQKHVDIVWERPLSAYIRDNSGILIEFMQAGWTFEAAHKP